MRFNVMSRDGSTIRYCGAPKYNGLFGKPSYIEFAEIASATPIEWQIGDYVDYSRTGFRYKLYTIPQVAKSATSGTAGDAFVYKNVQFFCATKDLEIALFRDIVEYDNGIHFSSIPNVDTYESVYGIIDRIQANMDDFAPGEWTIRAMSTSYTEITDLMSEVREFSLSDGTCMDALNQIYAIWKGISWIYKVENGKHTIVLGRPNLQDASNTTPEFSYGEGNGLKVLTRAVSTKNEIATRIYAYGSDRNMPTRYYNNLTPYIKDHESVYIPHLMLPQSDWGTTGGENDARLAYIENSTAVSRYGLIPKVIRFDGSNDREDIYPSVTGMTVGDVADADFPSTGWSSSDPIDTIYACTNPSDDGMYTDDSVKLKGEIVTLPVASLSKTYATAAGQEAVTMGNEAYIASTEPSGQQINPGGTAGRITVSLGGLHGLVSSSTPMIGFLTEVPKVFVEVYLGSTLMSSVEAKITTTQLVSGFTFECPDVVFTTSGYGHIYVYLRAELKLSDTSPALNLVYSHTATSVIIKDEYTIEKTFTLSLRQLGFDLNAMGVVADNGIGTLAMKTGLCAGREFVINSADYNSVTGEWVLECQRQDDTSIMQYFPNSVYTIESGDDFVLLDIQMPAKYVTAAETRLHNAAASALAAMCKPKMAYVPEVDSKEVFLASVTLVEGLYMPVYDPDLIETYIVSEPNVNWILIDTVTIAENEDVIPIWSVTLRDEKVESMLQIITGELNAANKRLRDNDVDKSRIPAQNDPDAVLVPTIVGVKIQADTKLFVSDANGNFTGQTITLTAVTQGINNPRYQWYYLQVVEQEGQDPTELWIELNDETSQAYVVHADSAIYYQDGRTYEDFKVIVRDYPRGDDTPISQISTYSDTIRISKGGRGPKGDDGDPGSDGENGWSYATLHLYRATSADPSAYPPLDLSYDFENKTLVSNDPQVTTEQALNGWSVEPPTSTANWFDVVYVTIANVASNESTVVVNGGWTTSGGDWSEPSRYAGENGLMGKVMRGINAWDEHGIPDGRGDNIDGYQGLEEVNSDFDFYDVVYTENPTTHELTYYYCRNGVGATSINPDDDSTGTCWVEATQFDFVATKVLLAKNAFIDVMSGNGVYMYGNNGASDGVVVAGMQGGSTTEWPVGSGTMVDQVNFFAGSNTPQEAPFRVYYDGSFVSTEGRIGGYNYDSDGLTAAGNRTGSNDGYYCVYKATEFAVSNRQQGAIKSVIANTNVGALVNDPSLEVYSSAPSGTALSVIGSTAINAEGYVVVDGVVQVTGDLQRYNLTTSEFEDAITFDAYNSSTNYDAILHVVHCSQDDYDTMESNNLLDDNTFYIIT